MTSAASLIATGAVMQLGTLRQCRDLGSNAAGSLYTIHVSNAAGSAACMQDSHGNDATQSLTQNLRKMAS